MRTCIISSASTSCPYTVHLTHEHTAASAVLNLQLKRHIITISGKSTDIKTNIFIIFCFVLLLAAGWHGRQLSEK